MAANPRLSFLIVEDDHFYAEAMAALLEDAGHRVRICRNPLEAVDAARAFKPDVALLDIMMPKMDGIELCRRLHLLSEADDMKTVMVTAKTYMTDHMRAMDAGACGILLKPIDPRTFVDDVFAQIDGLADGPVTLALQAA